MNPTNTCVAEQISMKRKGLDLTQQNLGRLGKKVDKIQKWKYYKEETGRQLFLRALYKLVETKHSFLVKIQPSLFRSRSQTERVQEDKEETCRTRMVDSLRQEDELNLKVPCTLCEDA